MAIRQSTPSPYDWRSRVYLKFLDQTYWWNKTGSGDIGGGKTITFMRNDTGDSTLKTHLREDISLTANTQFQSLVDLTPVGNILQTIQSYGGALGTALGGIAKFQQVETWKSTDPLSFNLTFHFDTDINPRVDVFLPTMALFAYTVPEETKNNLLKTPGPNIFTLLQKSGSKVQETAQSIGLSSDSSEKGRLISILIGGWLYLNEVVLIKADPTFSKNITESGYPLWSEVTLELRTLRTTTVDILASLGDDAQSYVRTVTGATPTF